MHVNNKFYLYSKILFNFLIILNYFFYLIFDTKKFFLVFSITIIFSFFFILFCNLKKNKIFFYFFTLLLIISLGSAVQVWDARSISMFNAKRIFFENSFNEYSQSYGINTHYPIFYPILAATINSLFLYWSEIIPKVSILFLSLIPLSNIYFEIKTKKIQLLFTFLFVLVFEHQILNGDIDLLIAIYFAHIVILISRILKNSSLSKNIYFYLELLLSTIIFLLTKPQSWILYLGLLISLLIIFIINNIQLKKILLILFIILISIIPAYHWKLITLSNYNFILTSDISLSVFKNNFSDFNNFFRITFFILDKILVQKSFMIISIFLTFIIVNTYYTNTKENIRKLIKTNFILLLFFSAMQYFLALFILYMSLASDLATSLQLTVDRYIVPINMILMLVGIVFLDKKKS
jgi:hypothetical protein